MFTRRHVNVAIGSIAARPGQRGRASRVSPDGALAHLLGLDPAAQPDVLARERRRVDPRRGGAIGTVRRADAQRASAAVLLIGDRGQGARVAPRPPPGQRAIDVLEAEVQRRERIGSRRRRGGRRRRGRRSRRRREGRSRPRGRLPRAGGEHERREQQSRASSAAGAASRRARGESARREQQSSHPSSSCPRTHCLTSSCLSPAGSPPATTAPRAPSTDRRRPGSTAA